MSDYFHQQPLQNLVHIIKKDHKCMNIKVTDHFIKCTYIFSHTRILQN